MFPFDLIQISSYLNRLKMAEAGSSCMKKVLK